MERRLAAQGYSQGPGIITSPAVQFSCAQRKTCKQMLSCEEAYHQLTNCGNAALDGNNDGIPCNSLCRGR
ncbi:MAG: excalibur calcium-binding domain-containing protein [Nitratireductor sp.]